MSSRQRRALVVASQTLSLAALCRHSRGILRNPADPAYLCMWLTQCLTEMPPSALENNEVCTISTYILCFTCCDGIVNAWSMAVQASTSRGM